MVYWQGREGDLILSDDGKSLFLCVHSEPIDGSPRSHLFVAHSSIVGSGIAVWSTGWFQARVYGRIFGCTVIMSRTVGKLIFTKMNVSVNRRV